jgi:uncharacterized protein
MTLPQSIAAMHVVQTSAMKIMKVIAVLLISASVVTAQDSTQEQKKTSTAPSTVQMTVPSHGSTLLGVFYLAAGARPHPTAVILHGFPGFEQNLDIAQVLRSNGWNALAMHYRGSWGVKGDFSFEHAAEDADTEVRLVLDAANAERYRIDTRHILVIGHSMGGFMAVWATAHNPQVSACVLISAWNIGGDYEMRRGGSKVPTLENEAKSLEEDSNLVPLSGTSGLALAREMKEHAQELNFLNLAQSLAPRPVLVITANDGLADSDHSLVETLRKAGDTRVTEQHWDTDHSYSGERQELSSFILQWANQNVAARPDSARNPE